MTIKKGVKSNLLLKKKLRSQMTPAENKLWINLRLKSFGGLKFRRQHGIGSYIVDFYCPNKKAVIEVDGDVHLQEVNVHRDLKRTEYLENHGLKVIRYFNNDIIENIDGVLEDLRLKLGLDLPPQTPPYKGGD